MCSLWQELKYLGKKSLPRFLEGKGSNCCSKIEWIQKWVTNTVDTWHHVALFIWHQTSQKLTGPWLWRQTKVLPRTENQYEWLKGGRKCNNAISIYRSVSSLTCFLAAWPRGKAIIWILRAWEKRGMREASLYNVNDAHCISDIWTTVLSFKNCQSSCNKFYLESINKGD